MEKEECRQWRPIGQICLKDIEELRKKIQIGDPVNTEVWLDRTGERLAVPKIRVRRVIGIYPHLVELDSSPGERVQTMTYAEMLVRRINGAEAVMK